MAFFKSRKPGKPRKPESAIIRGEDPEDLRTGYAAQLWDVAKMSALTGGAIAFASAILLKGKFMLLGAESWGSMLLVFAVLFGGLFAGAWVVTREAAGLALARKDYPEAEALKEKQIAGWMALQYGAAYASAFFFTVTVDVTAEALRGFGAGEYLLDFPAAVIFFYAAFPAIAVIVLVSGWVQGAIRRTLIRKD